MYLVLLLLASVALIIVLSTRLQVHPFLALLFACLFFGLLSGMPLEVVASAINDGFGGTLGKIGMVIILGVEEPRIWLLDKSIQSTYQLISSVVNGNLPFMATVDTHRTTEFVEYDDPYSGNGHWHMLPPIDCPSDPMKCMLSGTGLTHKASADNRQKMHANKQEHTLTDSMVMYLWGEEGGKPEKGKVGLQPEWFYKGNGSSLKGHNGKLIVPSPSRTAAFLNC